jgi:coenzyme F420-dependent glucose-6-phosphate dehydrogenase
MASTELRLGYWLSSEEHHPRQLVENAAAAEEAGFGSAMISDHLNPWTARQGQSAFVWGVLGALAEATRSLVIGTGVSATVNRIHPLVLAHAAATASVLMPGRFFLGLGTGERLNEQATGQRWPRPGERRKMLAAALPVLQRLLGGETVTYESRWFTVERAKLFTCPDAPPPIYVAASGKRTAQVAGELADGLIGASPDPRVVTAFEAAGGEGKPRLAKLTMCWAADEDDARRTALEWFPNSALPGAALSDLARPEDVEAVAALVGEADISRFVSCGPDPEVHLRAIARFVAAGYTEVYLHQIGPDQDGFLEFFQKELVPLVERT